MPSLASTGSSQWPAPGCSLERPSRVHYRPESRVREIRLHGSKGGATGTTGRPYPYQGEKGQRTRLGNVMTHCLTGTNGTTRSTRWAAVSAILRVVQEGQTPRPLHDQT